MSNALKTRTRIIEMLENFDPEGGPVAVVLVGDNFTHVWVSPDVTWEGNKHIQTCIHTAADTAAELRSTSGSC